MCCKKCFVNTKIPINMSTLHVTQFLVYIETNNYNIEIISYLWLLCAAEHNNKLYFWDVAVTCQL